MRIARISNLDAAQHLTNDHFNVLVIDLHALQTINVLHFVDDVASELFNAEETEDVMRINRTVDDFFTLLNDLTVVDENRLVLADQRFMRITFLVGNDETLLALRFLAERNRTGNFRKHAGILRTASFEEFRNTRQTARNIAGLLRLGRNTCEHFAHADILTVADNHEGAHRQLNRHGVVRARNLHLGPILIEEVNQGAKNACSTCLAALAGRLLRVDDDEARKTRHFVDLIHHGDVFDHVFELHATGVLRNNRAGHRIPRSQLLARLDRLISLHEER